MVARFTGMRMRLFTKLSLVRLRIAVCGNRDHHTKFVGLRNCTRRLEKLRGRLKQEFLTRAVGTDGFEFDAAFGRLDGFLLLPEEVKAKTAVER